MALDCSGPLTWQLECPNPGNPMSLVTWAVFSVNFYCLETVSITFSSPFDSRTPGSSLTGIYGEGLEWGNAIKSQDTFLWQIMKIGSGWGFPSYERQAVIHTHDNQPFLASFLPVVFWYFSLFNTCWIKSQGENLGLLPRGLRRQTSLPWPGWAPKGAAE